MTDAYQATLDPRMAPQGDALAARGGSGDALGGDFNQVIQQQRQGIQDYGKLMQDRQRAMAPLVAQAGQMARQPLPQPPAQQPLPAAPQRNSPEADESWLMVAGVLGAIAGAFTRQHVTNALGAMTGALEGYQQGSQQRFDQNVKIWSAEAKKIEETNRQATERYTQILNNRKMAFEQKMQELQLVAAEYKDMAAMQLVQNGQVEKLGDLIMRRDQLGAEMKKWDAQLRQQFATYEQRERLAKERTEATLEAARLRAGGGERLNDAAIDERAELFFAGNPNWKAGLSTRSPDWPRLSNRIAEVAKERNISPEEVNRMQTKYAGETSYQRSAGTMSARVESASNEVQQLVPQALEASKNLPRGKFVPVNRLRQAYEAGTSDPRYNDFLMANFSLEKAYGRAMNPQGVPRVSEAMEAKADGILSIATSPEAYAVQVRRLMLEVEASKRAVAQTREGIKPAGGTAAPPPPAMSGEMPVPDPEGWKQLAPGIRYREVSP